MSHPSDVEYPRRVVVDDTDPRIKYEQGTWTIDTNSFDAISRMGSPYNSTQHGTASTTASFSFQFEGDFVQVLGTKDNRKYNRPAGAINDTADQVPKWTCQVDGSPITQGFYYVSIFDVTHNMLCEQGRLSRDPHTLTVNITLNDTSTQMFWLDKVEYAPLPGADLTKEVMKFDSSDPSIQYENSTGTWNTNGFLMNQTGTTGSSASFRFNGTSVSLYGFNEGSELYHQPATARYYIDNTGDTSFDLSASKPIPGFPDNKSDWYNQLWFTASNIDPGSHEMVLTYTGVYHAPNVIQWLSIDYLYVTSSEGSQLNPANPAGGSSGSSGGSGNSGGMGNSGGSGKGSNGESGSSSNTNVGAIAGGVVGGVAGLVLIALAIFFVLKKHKAKENHPGQYDGFQPQNMYSASQAGFIPQHPTMSVSTAPPMSVSTVPPMSSNYDPYQSLNYTGSSHGDSSSASNSGLIRNSMAVANPGVFPSHGHYNQNWTDMKRAQRDAVNPGTTERHHQDSGRRYPQPTVVDIPPNYTPS